MKLTSRKKIAALLGTSLLAIGASGCSNIKGVQDVKELYHSEETKQETTQETTQKTAQGTNSPTKEEILIFKEELQEQFDSSKVVLDADSNKYISSVYIDGVHVKVELVDGSTINGNLSSIELSDLDLENFSLYDSKFESVYELLPGGKHDEFREEYSHNDHIIVSIPSSIRVTNTLKMSDQYEFTKDDETFNDDDAITCDDTDNVDFSLCKNVWLHDYTIWDTNDITSNPNLKTLIIDGADYLGYTDDEVLTIESPTLETLIINSDPSLNHVTSFDFNNCPNLRFLSFGNATLIENLDGLSKLEKLEEVSFGNHKSYNPFSMRDSIEDKIREIRTPQALDDPANALPNYNYITNIEGLKNKENLRVLNISALRQTSSEELFDVVQTLPNLEKIVGLEVNNAEMCSPELIQYCSEHNIEHPFTEKSMLIKETLRSIIREIITPDMTEEQKIEAISKYVMEHLEYDHDAADKDSSELTSEDVRRAWTENLYSTAIDGIGLCAGYTEFTQALFTEAGITNFHSETIMHIFNIVELDGIYYQIDLTNLDHYLSVCNINIEDYDFQMNSVYYLVPVEDEEAWYATSEPYGAKLQREKYSATNEEEKEDNENENETSSSLDNYNKAIEERHKRTYKLLGLLAALGIAIPISGLVLNQLLFSESSIQESPTDEFTTWTPEEYEELIDELAQSQDNSISVPPEDPNFDDDYRPNL